MKTGPEIEMAIQFLVWFGLIDNQNIQKPEIRSYTCFIMGKCLIIGNCNTLVGKHCYII
jgi:hypothetical protein